MTTPSAYAEITWPAVGIETSTPSAICGSTPIVTNSVVPMAKPPVARASTARPKCVGRAAGGASGGAVVVISTHRPTPAVNDLFRDTAGQADDSRGTRGRAAGQSRSKRSSSITFTQALTKSATNVASASSLA